jgi:DNA mismatch endonuclease (patch repair protein)
MTDIWSSKKRSEVMAKIRKTNSSPERVLRMYLTRANIAYQIYAALPGTPDIIIEQSKLAVFVHGCFWHGCRYHYRLPNSNVEYWSAKLRSTRARDRVVMRRLRAMRWHTAVVWECQLRDPKRVLGTLQKRLQKLDGMSLSLRGNH